MNSSATWHITDSLIPKNRSSARRHCRKSESFVSLLLASILCSSCCTTALWDATDPNETIEVSPDEVTEAALIEDGFTFHQDEKSGYFHIEKTAKQKAGDYSLRVVGTPVAIGADTLLVGVFFMGVMYGMDPAEVDWSDSSI